jgi:hypothetical protein
VPIGDETSKIKMSSIEAQATIDELRARLRRFEDLFLCTRCDEIGHNSKSCLDLVHLNVAADDVFMQGRIDRRIIHRLPTVMWQVALTYLPASDIIPHVPRACKYMNYEVVWGEHAGKLLWTDIEFLDAAITMACKQGAPIAHISALLAGGGVDMDVNDGLTTLFIASKHGHIDIVRALIAAGADPNHITCFNSPLIVASDNGHSSIVSTLLDAGANVNYTDENRQTAIWGCKHIDCVRILLDARADISIRDYKDRTALDIARRNWYDDIAELLERAQNEGASEGDQNS